MLKLTNNKKYSLSIRVWLADDNYDHAPVKGPYLSATGILKPVKQIVLSKRAKPAIDPMIEEESKDLSTMVATCLGTAVHSSIEHTWLYRYKKAMHRLGYSKKVIDSVRINPDEEARKEPGIVAVYMEQRGFKTIEGVTIGGKFDFIGNGVLEDFKSMQAYGYMQQDKEEEQKLQGSIYKLIFPELITADYMLVQQIITDWSKLNSVIQKKRGYPQDRIVGKKVKLYSKKEITTWLTERIRLIKSLEQADEADMPPCTQKELWQSDTVYKYYKNPDKLKRSSGNFDNFHEADLKRLKAGVGIVKEYPGEVRRCGYCDAFSICKQKDIYKEAGILKMPA